MNDSREQLVSHFLAGVAPLIEMAIQIQPGHEARKIAGAVADGTGRLELIALMGADGELHLELSARLPDGDRRLVTVAR